MNLLVNGGAGYIGNHMIMELVDASESFVAINIRTTIWSRSWRVHVRSSLDAPLPGDVNESVKAVDEAFARVNAKRRLTCRRRVVCDMEELRTRAIVPDRPHDPIIRLRVVHRPPPVPAVVAAARTR